MGGAGRKKGTNLAPRLQLSGPITLREEWNGRKRNNVNAKTMCKIDHLQNLALWAGAEASIPSLGAFFGERLAATNETLGLRSDPTLFVCERCESILQPGNNCTVRIEKNRSKGRRRQKKSIPKAQNNLVYRCHSCSHRNLMRGTLNSYVKEICPLKPKPRFKSKKTRDNSPSLGNGTMIIDSDALLPLDEQNFETIAPATPLPATSLSLLESKRRKRNRSSAKNVANPQSSAAAADLEKSSHASSKRRKKSWTSLKEIAESSGQTIGKKLTDLTIPFFI